MISIVTPVLNGALFIENNIKSIKQLSIPFEHIIVDGGSSDETLNILSKYPHLTILHQKDGTGMYGAIHQGFLKSKGDYFSYVNADDAIIVEGFETMYFYIKKNNVDVVYSDSLLKYKSTSKIVKHKGNKYAKYFIKRGILPFIQPSSIYSKSVYYKVGGLLFNKFRICGDIDFFYRIALLEESKFHYCKVISSCFLMSKNSLGSANSKVGKNEKIANNIPISSLKNKIIYKILSYNILIL